MKNPIFILSLVLLLCFVFGCQDKAEKAELEKFRAQAEIEKQNEAIVRQVFEAIDAQDFARFQELLAPELIGHYSGPQEDLTVDSIIQLIKTFYQAFPDYSHSVEDAFAKGDKVVVRILQNANQKAEFQGIPPGNKISYYQISIMQVKDGKVIGWWVVEDNLGMMTQLGLELKPKEVKK
jgi:predicted ester cyclase